MKTALWVEAFRLTILMLLVVVVAVAHLVHDQSIKPDAYLARLVLAGWCVIGHLSLWFTWWICGTKTFCERTTVVTVFGFTFCGLLSWFVCVEQLVKQWLRKRNDLVDTNSVTKDKDKGKLVMAVHHGLSEKQMQQEVRKVRSFRYYLRWLRDSLR